MSDPRAVGIGMLGTGCIGDFHGDGLRDVPNARVTRATGEA